MDRLQNLTPIKFNIERIFQKKHDSGEDAESERDCQFFSPPWPSFTRKQKTILTLKPKTGMDRIREDKRGGEDKKLPLVAVAQRRHC